MTQTNNRQIQGRGYPYLIFDADQHKHLRMDGVLVFDLHKSIGHLETMLSQQMTFWLSTIGTPTIRAGGMFLDAQYVAADVTAHAATSGAASVSFYLVEQRRIGGFYPSDRTPEEHLRAAVEDVLRHHFTAFNYSVRKELKWITFGPLHLTHIEHNVRLTNELKAKMEAAEADYWAFLQQAVKGKQWEFLQEMDPDSPSRFLNSIHHYGHGSAIHEEELLDYGLVPQGRKLTFNQADGSPAMDIYGLIRSASREKVPLSYVMLRDRNSGFVLSKDIDELNEMASADFKRQEPPNRPDLEQMATEPGLVAPAGERAATTGQDSAANKEAQ